MSISELRFIKRFAEFRRKTDINDIPPKTRGLYALLNKKPRERYEVVYIGMARGLKSGVRGRLHSHEKSNKGSLWTHFSVYEVWDNITESEVAELEGLFRHIYRKDLKANRINRQRSFKKLRNVLSNDLKSWRIAKPH
jgi:hypothetical protein